MASDLRIPGTQRYEGIVLDREMARYLAGEITVEQALAERLRRVGRRSPRSSAATSS